MRIFGTFLALMIAAPVAPLAATPAEPQALEQAWHRCVREAYAHQPAGQSRAGNERNALDECKEREDAYVDALMTAHPQSAWARALTAMTAPLSFWVGLFRR